MARENYDLSVTEVLRSEGGYTNDPHDPGGPTNYGITIHDYRAYINHNGTAEDVRHMTVEQAKAIYKAKYWDAVDGDHLASGVDYCVFDYGVNSGISRANRIYNYFVPRQYAASKGSVWLIDQICNERLAFLQRLATWRYFGKGWARRVLHVRMLAKSMVAKEDPKPIAIEEIQKGERWLTTPTKNSPQPSNPSSTTSSSQPTSKESPTLWQKISSMVSSKGSAPIA